MKRSNIFLLLTFLFPFVTFAASLQTDIKNLLTFSNTILLPFILGIAFLFVVINAIRFFVIGGATEDGHDKAKNLAIYGVSAFVVIVIFWGLVNLISSSLGYAGEKAPTLDYVEQMKKK
jgi:fumarate reductase subunit D